MPHHDEKGRIDPAQSKAARLMRNEKPHLSGKSLGEMGDKGYGGEKHGKHAYGQTHVGVGGMARMAQLKEANKGKKAKSRIVLRGQKSDYRKTYTKVGKRMHQKGLLSAPKA